MGAGWDNMHLVNYRDEALGHFEFRRAFEKDPFVSIAGASTVSMFTEKLRVDLVLLGDRIALRAMDVFFEVLQLKPHAFEKSSGSLGCPSRRLDWRFWAA